MKTYRKKQPALRKPCYSANLPLRRALNLAILAILYPSFSYANPDGAQVISGQVSIDTATPGVTTITNSPNAIINWQNFSIAQNELTQFIQQNGQSAVLNRIIGQNPSEILGQLASNGKVFLINPNGIVFGAGASIDTQGLIASSLNLSDQDFLSGNYHFIAGSSAGNILNEGIIRAGKDGNIILIAPQIKNNGIIKSDGGSITLAAGQELTITNLDDPDIRFQIQAPSDNVINLGKLLTEGGAVNVFANTIKHSGEINADSVEVDAQGNIRLVAQQDITLAEGSKVSANNSQGNAGAIHIESKTGTTLAQGAIEAHSTSLSAGQTIQTGKGGKIELLGEQVGILNRSRIDANGKNGGGEVLIGGDYQGKNTNIHNAKATYVGKDTIITADAQTNGDGGKVIVWADDTARAYGNISARGGQQSGNGGFVETSGHRSLAVDGIHISASAANGTPGMWLLDPSDITVISGSGTAQSGLPYLFNPAISSFISDGTITSTLTGGTDVTLKTDINGTGNGDILFSSGVNINAGASPGRKLTLEADRNIDLQGTFSTASVGSLTVELNPGQTVSGGKITSSGSLLFNGAGGSLVAEVKNGKTWNNASTGTITLQGNSQIHLHDGTSPATFKNYGVFSTASTANFFFYSDSTDSGVVNNYGTFNVNNTGSIEAQFNQNTDSGAATTNLSDGTTLSVQNLGFVKGTINLGNSNGSSKLWISEDHGSDMLFEYTTINNHGSGNRLWVGGSSVFGSSVHTVFDSVTAPDVDVTLDSMAKLKIEGSTRIGTLNFSNFRGTTAGKLDEINNGVLGISTGDFSIPGGVNYTGNVGYFAAGDLNVPSTISTSATSGVLTLKAGNAIIVDVGASITTQGQAVILNSDSDAANGGAIQLNTGSSINSNGGDITLGGGNGTISAGTGFAKGSGAINYNGVTVNGNLTAAGGNIVINGIADAVTNGINNPRGVEISTGSVSTVGNGTITLTGFSMNPTTIGSPNGVVIGDNANAGGSVTSEDGAILFNGTAGSSYNSIGVNVYYGTVQATGSGSITLNGTVGNNAAANALTRGIDVESGSVVRTNSGTLTLNGVNTSTSVTNLNIVAGVHINGQGTHFDSTVDSTSGAINIIGSAVNGVGQGVLINNPTPAITIGNNTTGDILIDAKNGTGITLYGANVKGTGNITLNAEGGGDIYQAGGYLQATGLRVLNDTNISYVTLNSANNNVSNFAANLTGADSRLSYSNSVGLAIGSINSVAMVGDASSSTNGIILDGDFTLNAGGTITATEAVNIYGARGTFSLNSGTWSQIAASLPSFSATDFQLSGGTFIRALGGDGSSGSPYQLTDVYGLQGMGSSAMLSKYYTLSNNIDASGTTNWNNNHDGGLFGFAPVGDASTGFTGHFNGESHTIDGLFIARHSNDKVGLFGAIDNGSSISNVGLTNVDITGKTYVGSLVGFSQYQQYSPGSSISNSHASGSVSGTAAVGGLIGQNYSAITSSYANVDVTGVDFNSQDAVYVSDIGGLAGAHQGTITNSYATGNVTGSAGNVGGLVGATCGCANYFGLNYASPITNSYATGTVTGANAGGLVGRNFWTAITNSYATGNVIASIYGGGLIGSNENGGPVTETYATGHVGGSGTLGGLVGNNNGGTLTNSFWDNITSSQTTGIGVNVGASSGNSGLDTAQMKQFASFSSWNNIADTGGSNAIWRIYEGYTAPLLRSFLTPLTITANNNSKTYDGSAYNGGQGITYSISDATLLGTLTYTGDSQGAINAGSYNITPAGFYSTSQQGYDINYLDGALTINAATLNAMSGTRAYDGTVNVAAGIFTLSGLMSGENLTLSGVGTIADKNVGNHKPVTLGSLTLGNGTNGLASNYTFTGGTYTVNITKAALAINASTDSKTYDGNTTSTGTVTYSGLQPGDSLTGLNQAYASKNVLGTLGSTLNVNTDYTLTDGNSGGNYTVNTNSASGTITKANLTVTANDANQTYNGLAYDGIPGLQFSAFVSGENATVLSGAPDYAFSGNHQDAGRYTITPSGLSATNYAI
ncbi:MAG: filamentous hemagglutinin N-terminal domain-containing protein, partial [Methylobacter sp.]